MAKMMEDRSKHDGRSGRRVHPCPSDEAGEEPPGHHKQCRAAQVHCQAAHARDYSLSCSPEASSNEETKTKRTLTSHVPTCRSFAVIFRYGHHDPTLLFLKKIVAPRRLYPCIHKRLF